MIDEKVLVERLEEEINDAKNLWDDDEYYIGQANAYEHTIAIVNQLSEEQKQCIKSSCSNCETYDNEKHYCPKWCDVIENTVKELAEEMGVSKMENTTWIACSERLPNESERWLGHDIIDAEPREFIVMVKGAYEPTTGYYTVDGWVKDIYNKEEYGYADEIIAWMPFPEPFKPISE